MTLQNKERIAIITWKMLNYLEMIQAMPDKEIIEAAGAMEEISEYVESIQETIQDLQPSLGNDYERLTGHEMGVCIGRV